MPLWIITFFLGTFSLTFLLKNWCLVFFLVLMPIFSKKPFFHIMVFAIGFFWALIYTHYLISWSLPKELEKKQLIITGYVTDIPNVYPYSINFKFQTDEFLGEKRKIKLKLSWFGKYPQINPGDKWQLLVSLKRPHGVLNPGGFDLEKHLLINHIRATGYVVKSDSNQKIGENAIPKLRQFLIAKMEGVLANEPLTPIIIAFVTGFENKITQSQWEVLRNSGTIYLVAVSGLHIGLIASLVFIITQFLWRLAGRLPLVIPARNVAAVFGLFAGFIYSLIAGFSIPTQRALIILFMFSLTILFQRHTKTWNNWMWSLLFVILINPLGILTIGFWLSFLAVAAIIYVVTNRIKQKANYIQKMWQIQIAVTIVLLPLTLLFFQQTPLLTIPANLIAMPLVSTIVIPLCLLGTLLLGIPLIGTWILLGTAKLLNLVWWWLEFLAKAPYANWYQPIHNYWILAGAFLGAVLLLTPRGFPSRYLGVLGFFPLFFYQPVKPETNGFWLTVLDVGQGLATVIQTKNHTLVYDAGPKFFASDAGSNTVVPFLRSIGIKKLDMVIVSHGDSDHSGGIAAVKNNFETAEVLTSDLEKLSSFNPKQCIAGQFWIWDGVIFQILSPPEDHSLSGNNSSCVLKVSNNSGSVLLPGDIEKSGENLLIRNHSSDLKSDILIAPHHGSSTSSKLKFIKLVNPDYVVFATGYKNKFRFPSKKITARYKEINSILLNTPETGAITFKFTSKSAILPPTLYREVIRKFWHD